tara:strand:- start:3148 stop:3300 length:153 start_codon:yes stop_codon:yes gene_type:complete
MKDEIKNILEKLACIDIKIVIFIIFLLLVGFYGYLKYAKEEGEDCQCGAN